MIPKCSKCGYESPKNKLMFSKYICNFCRFFAPDDEEKYYRYIEEKVDYKLLETYRKQNMLSGFRQKKGMKLKAKKGNVMSRAPLGYKIINNHLEPAENWRVIEEIFEEFNKTEISLNQLSKKYGLSINGLKKVLRNFTYLGKIKFDGEIHDGDHKPIVPTILFNHVQDKLERLGIKK